MSSSLSLSLSLSQAKLALFPDPLVRSALEYKIKQSSSYAKKLSTVTQTNKLSFLLFLNPPLTYLLRNDIPTLRDKIKSTLNDNLTSFYEEKSVLFLSKAQS